jgi:hypothetical protein
VAAFRHSFKHARGLYGLAIDRKQRRALGDDIELEITAPDETNTRIRPDRIARATRRDGGLGMVGIVGVRSNRFPHALDIARKLQSAGMPGSTSQAAWRCCRSCLKT